MFPCLTLLLALFLQSAVLADPETEGTDDETALTLGPHEEVTVVGSPIIEGTHTTPLGTPVTVVGETQIEDLNAQDLPSALRMTPGVVISRHNPIGSFGGGEGGSVFIRGHGSSRPGAEIVTAVDGIPKFVSVWTHPLMDVIGIDLARRIEVYKGAEPVLFGNAAFGVVNVVPKSQDKDGLVASIEGAYGSFGTWVETAEIGGKRGRWDGYLVQSFRRSDGHRESSDGELQNYFGRAGFALSDRWRIGFLFNRSVNDVGDPGPSPDLVPPSLAYRDGRFQTDDYFSVVSLEHRATWAEGWVKAYWENGDIDWIDQFDSATGLHNQDTLTDYDNYGVRFRETLRPWPSTDIIAGLDVDTLSGEVTFVDPPQKDILFPREHYRITAPYAAVTHRVGIGEGAELRPSIGLRAFVHSRFENTAAPQAGLVLAAGPYEVHANYARGVNYPGLYVEVQSKVFMPGDNQQELLKPETLDHYELGLSRFWGHRIRVEGTLFSDHGRNRIVVAPPPPFPPRWSNIEVYRTRGAELTVSGAPNPDITLFAGATYLDSDPSDLPYSPKWSASAGAVCRLVDRLRLSVDGLYVGRHAVMSRARSSVAVNTYWVDSAFLLNGKVSYSLRSRESGSGAGLFLAVENLLDDDYQQKYGYPMPGRSMMLGLKWGLS